VRVGGSWIAAAGLLTLGWIARADALGDQQSCRSMKSITASRPAPVFRRRVLALDGSARQHAGFAYLTVNRT